MIRVSNTQQAKKQLHDILSQKEYQIYHQDNRNFLEVWWDHAKHWIAEQISKWFASFEPSSGLAAGILITIGVIVLALLALIVFLVIRAVKRRRTFHDHQPLQAVEEHEWASRDHLSEASRQEARENYSLATRHMFLALLLHFHENGWLEARSWKTNWDYFDELRKVNARSAEQFYNLALLFDEVFYGERAMQKQDYIPYRDEALKWLDGPQDVGNDLH